MLGTYLLPVETAVTWFPVLAALIMLPAAFVSYRRRGRAGGWATLVFYSFVFYLLAAYLQTVIPLPSDPEGYCAGTSYASTPQLRPFVFVDDIAGRAGGEFGIGALAGNPALWTTAFNVVLLLPLGVYLRYYLGKGVLFSTVAAFGMSLFFELTQLTGLWYIYPCAYRLFNVDDLLCNTAGAVLGWLIAGPLRRVLPSLDPERDRHRYAGRVTFTRRVLSLCADLVGFAGTVLFSSGLTALFGGPEVAFDVQYWLLGGVGLVWFGLFPVLTGSTPGKRAMLLRVVRVEGGRAGFWRLLLRNGVLLAPLWLLWLGLVLDQYHMQTGRMVVIGLWAASLLVTGVWSPLAALFTRDRRAPYERWSGTVNVAVLPRRRSRAGAEHPENVAAGDRESTTRPANRT